MKTGFSTAETGAATLVVLLAAPVVLGYLFDWIAGALHPVALMVCSVAVAVGAAVWLGRRRPERDDSAADLIVITGLVLTVFAWLVWLSWPSLLPIGGGGDVTHHVLLIDYIERHGQLVHDPGAEAYLGEMSQYTPGLHLLALLSGVLFRTDGLHAVHAVVSFTVALKVGILFLIAKRVIESDDDGGSPSALPLALVASVLPFAAPIYVLGSFLRDAFLAQAAAELFAVVMWWMLVVSKRSPDRAPLVLFAVAGAAVFLTWPIWVGPPMLALVLHAMIDRQRTLIDRVRVLAVGGGPVVLVAVIYMVGRLGWTAMAGTSGAVPWPSVRDYGWPFLIASVAGVAFALAQPRQNVTLLMSVAIIVQGVALLTLARLRGADTPYMALKMFYLLIYPQAMFAAIALATAWRLATARAFEHVEASRRRSLASQAIWVVAGVLAFVTLRPVVRATWPAPITTEPLLRAGRWARANLPADCVEYLVPDSAASYWVHLSLLGNPRMSPRTADDRTFQLREALTRWIQPGGLSYAIADLDAIPRGVRDELDVLQQFQGTVVARRREPSACPEQH
jgi:hypothetical protein